MKHTKQMESYHGNKPVKEEDGRRNTSGAIPKKLKKGKVKWVDSEVEDDTIYSAGPVGNHVDDGVTEDVVEVDIEPEADDEVDVVVEEVVDYDDIYPQDDTMMTCDSTAIRRSQEEIDELLDQMSPQDVEMKDDVEDLIASWGNFKLEGRQELGGKLKRKRLITEDFESSVEDLDESSSINPSRRLRSDVDEAQTAESSRQLRSRGAVEDLPWIQQKILERKDNNKL